MTRIATFNVNSIKARMANVLAWLDEFDPDIALFQEIKSTEESFPRMELEAAGYNIAISGQKSYNGVAIFSKTPLEVVRARLPGGDGEEQARYIEAVTETDAGVLRVASIYLPNGNPVDTDKFVYKLAWMERLIAHARDLLALEEPVVLGGDYNVIPQGEDCHDPAAWQGDALFRPESRAAFRRLLALGYTEAFRTLNPHVRAYTFWDYQGGAWQNDRGIRIDHLLLSPQAADLLTDCRIDQKPRGRPKASDHTPIWCELAAA
ncbi:MAG: exodeoxyribonuclease III [Rhodospirillaceae bacterium]|nr:exodeoxyribonuclease III [Rhodospirillaceae bacterium]MYH37672.1 exodeoxyribonuclease III [Rhodospirillaceae bacterium]MYK14275.1 exodeoxyribonuclease III [Rhodospirillaceae bacterium]MYK58207.1 exodeoxyribonuclease III [Rhodospirillaceae bacterium]